ncbi:MAG: cation-translocating P-type ATPase [Oscillatoriales cyanobacterium SM2_2_1]|nr:cation-translocating P-type ATPase [Oscillatoriales cyanobacterium SM2_2_1]
MTVRPPHALDRAAVLAQWQTSSQGLDQKTAVERLAQYGRNELTEQDGRLWQQILWEQFQNVMLLLLLAVALISGILDLVQGEVPKDAIAIGIIIGINATLGFLQERQAEQAMAALRRLTAPTVTVCRHGQTQTLAAAELVPGDIYFLEAGAQVAADGRLLESQNLQVKEAALTGESAPITKNADLILAEDTSLGDRHNFVYQSTEVVQGRGKVVVTATGMATQIGQVAQMLQGVAHEPTPLQQRMDQLSQMLVYGALLLVVMVMVGGGIVLGGDRLGELLEVSLSMAVAVVPEGLPAVVTVTLALGMQRLARQRALIRRLPAVETLGSVTVICTDKTGTLTQNKMAVREIATPDGHWRLWEANPEPMSLDETLGTLMDICHHCNDAKLKIGGYGPTAVGDPTEVALLQVVGQLGHQPQPLLRRHEVPFSSEQRRMSVLVEHSVTGKTYIFAKGSPDVILMQCSHQQRNGALSPFTDEARRQILDTNDAMAQRGLRVMGFAAVTVTEPLGSTPLEQVSHLVWHGLIGIADPPRPEVVDAVASCRQAGIIPVMITGDHPLTAMAIAKEVGIFGDRSLHLTGAELDQIPPERLSEKIAATAVFARVTPAHKLQIVRALQARHHLVAMTGDGINDAPALKQADIGIAMGQAGTDVAKDASAMILQDDNFATIVRAIAEGRVVYTNIRRFVQYILGSNVGEAIAIAAIPLLGLTSNQLAPLTPLQILWMNLVTDGLPALALAMEPAEPNVMQRPPHPPQESIFARGLGSYILRIGCVFAVVTISFAFVAARLSPNHWRTMVFTTLCLAQMGHALALRSHSQLTLELNPVSNPAMLPVLLLTSGLQILLLYLPATQNFFGVEPLTGDELSLCLGFSTSVFVWVELEKLLNLRNRPRRSP